MPTPELFSQLELDERILVAIGKLGFERMTPIQARSIPSVLAGRDVIGRARTGSGKTAAFGLPLIHRLRDGEPGTKAIILCPTRELALQVSEALRTYARGTKGLRIATVYGGAPYPPQIKALKNGANIVVGTPGRVIDHLQRGTLSTENIETVVLDEADEMLRMGFIDAVREVLDAVPEERQVVLFSATMPKAIEQVAERYLREPDILQVEQKALTVDHIEQFGIVVQQRAKIEALQRVLEGRVTGPTLVFCRTRLGCAETADALARRGVAVDALHGNLTQAARERVLGRFRARGLDIVIATDVAARGLDVDHITHVINFDLPADVETYVHRIGRTGRAGRKGTAISFVTPRERRSFRHLQRALRVTIEEIFVPGDGQITYHKQTLLVDELGKALAEPSKDARRWVTDVARQTGFPIDEIAAAAIGLLAEARGTSLEAVEPDKPRSKKKPSAGQKDKGAKPTRGSSLDMAKSKTKSAEPKKRDKPKKRSTKAAKGKDDPEVMAADKSVPNDSEKPTKASTKKKTEDDFGQRTPKRPSKSKPRKKAKTTKAGRPTKASRAAARAKKRPKRKAAAAGSARKSKRRSKA